MIYENEQRKKFNAFGDFEYKTPTRIDATHAQIFIPGIQPKNIQIQLESNFHPKILFFSSTPFKISIFRLNSGIKNRHNVFFYFRQLELIK